MKKSKRTGIFKRTAEVTSPPPLRYLRDTISVKDFSLQISKFLQTHFNGFYSLSLEECTKRELHISVDGFSAFVYSNFAAAGYSFQNMHISSYLDGAIFNFVMEYDTSGITENLRENMNRASVRSGFDFVIEEKRVTVTMATERRFTLDISALRRRSLYDMLVRIFSSYGKIQ